MEEPDLAGATIAGRYDVLALLGAGGMGAVYRAHDRELDELVALKVIRGTQQPAMVEQFRHEVKLARRVTHTNIARTFELGWSDGVMFCTMELVDGESLRARLARTRTLSPTEAATIARALCRGLDAAHAAGVIHRDIKPENVLLASNGRVVLADFGVAAITQTDTGGFLAGTLAYMAPEQARGEAPTPATDVYAVGAVLFEMLTGMRAFAGTMTEVIVAKQDVERLEVARAPEGLREVVARATAREPGDRIATASELADALAPWSMELPASVPDAAPANLATVVVLAPRAGEGGRLHLAEGVHHELLQRLSQQPRVRVWPRMTAVDVPDATVVALHATDALEVTIEHAGASMSLRLPLEPSTLAMAAASIAGTIADAIASPPTVPSESFELLLRARSLAHHGFFRAREAVGMLRRAHELDPDDPSIAAELAAVLIRNHFIGAGFEDAFDLAPGLVKRALAAAPELAEAHVAAAHLQLHTGDPVAAANAYRAAIARSPYLAEPHEGLGRMLLEAGFLADAMSRIEDALAIAPNLYAVRWEVARAHALEDNWGMYDEIVAELCKVDDRPISRLRFAMWRGDHATIEACRNAMRGTKFEAEMFAQVFATIDGRWSDVRDAMVARGMAGVWPSKRRNAFISQVVVETAGYAGDPVSFDLVRRAVDFGLYDLHWLDRSPAVAVARAHPDFASVRAIVKQRADGIHDALFHDLVEVQDTVLTG